MGAKAQLVLGPTPAIVWFVLFGGFSRCGAAIQNDLDVFVILKTLDEQFVQRVVLSRNDEQVPRSYQRGGLGGRANDPAVLKAS